MPGALRAAYRKASTRPERSQYPLDVQHIELFKTQLRAILRAAVHGNARIMFPLISTLLELRHCKMVLADVMEDLDDQSIPFRKMCRSV